MPLRCPFAGGRAACCLRVNHYRARKSGPCYPVAVVGCRIHGGGCFTLYPPGHVPYGRKPVAPQGPSGVFYVREGTQASGTRLQPWWRASFFSAAVDAAAGARWPEESLSEDARRRRTQGRRLAAAVRLTGVHPALEERTREQIAVRLGVPLLTLREAALRWCQEPSWCSRGEAVMAVLDAVHPTGALPDRILAAGAAADLWPEPLRWRGRRSLRRCSEVPEHLAMPDGGRRAPPPTTSPVASREEGL
jgi:hypothetical protein